MQVQCQYIGTIELSAAQHSWHTHVSVYCSARASAAQHRPRGTNLLGKTYNQEGVWQPPDTDKLLEIRGRYVDLGGADAESALADRYTVCTSAAMTAVGR